MVSNPPPPAGGSLPPKPWEGGSSGGISSGTPFKPPSSGNTSEIVESSGAAKPGEMVPATQRNVTVNGNALARPAPPRPWESNYGSNYGYGSGLNYNSGYGSGMYNSYGGIGGSYGGSYGGSLYGNNSLYNRGYGGLYGSSGMYGGSMYGGGGYGGMMGSYGMGMGAPYGGNGNPNNPNGPPPSPPGFWMSFLRVMHGVVDFFGRIAILIDQNTQAFHMFMSALLQLFDRSGLLYGELARFALRLLGIRTKPGRPPLAPVGGPAVEAKLLMDDGSRATTGSWDGVWGKEGAAATRATAE